MMDRDEQIAPQTVGARHTLKQTAQPRPSGDQSDCFVEACIMQRLCDDVGKLKIEFVFWHAAGTIRAGRSSRVPHINEHSKCRSGAIAALAAVQRYRVLSARKLPRGASKHHSQRDKSENATFNDDHRLQLCRCCGFAAQPTLSGISPRVFIPVCLPSYKQYDPTAPPAIKGRNI